MILIKQQCLVVKKIPSTFLNYWFNFSVHFRTFEEKINDIIKSKQELVNLTVSTGESWISEMSDKDLKKLFAI